MKNRKVPRYFQKLNDYFNMGKFEWETGKPKPQDDGTEGKDEIDLLMEQQQKKNINFKRRRNEINL